MPTETTLACEICKPGQTTTDHPIRYSRTVDGFRALCDRHASLELERLMDEES